MKIKLPTLAIACAFGLLTGARAMSGPTLLSGHLVSAGPPDTVGLNSLLACFFGAKLVHRGMRLVALSELVGDKWFFTVPRTDPAPLAGRVASGLLAGALVAVASGEGPAAPALAGAIGTVPGAFASYAFRRLAGERTPLPDPLLGVAEDLFVYGTGYLLLRALPGQADELAGDGAAQVSGSLSN